MTEVTFHPGDLDPDEVATLVSGQSPWVILVLSGGRGRPVPLDVIGPYFGPDPSATAIAEASKIAAKWPAHRVMVVPLSSAKSQVREYTETHGAGWVCSRCATYSGQPLRRELCKACRRRAGQKPTKLSPWERAQAGVSRNPGPMGTHATDKSWGTRGAGGHRRLAGGADALEAD